MVPLKVFGLLFEVVVHETADQVLETREFVTLKTNLSPRPEAQWYVVGHEETEDRN